MNTTVLSLSLSLIIGFVLGSPLELRALEDGIVPSAEINYRLSSDVVPIRYVLHITPYFVDEGTKKAFTFDGNLQLTVNASKTGIRSFVLHAHKLNLINYIESPSTNHEFKAEQYDNVTDKWTLTFNDQIATDATTIVTITYSGTMEDDMNGFYRSFFYEGGTKIAMASTQFQQTEARRAFPCFDEPGFKAYFKLNMIRPKTMNTLSNMQLDGDPTDYTSEGLTIPRQKDVFKTTPLISSYLLAFIVSNYTGSQNTDKTFGVFARPEAIETTKYALDFGQKMIKSFGEYLNMSYYSFKDVKKIDMAAIPDFSAGAMENLGLLTYREASILYDEDTTSAISQQRIAAVIAHEQAHQWFGDLLTCKWWDETWLNEGFGRYFQFFGTQMLEKDWDLDWQFVVENLQQSMQLDSTDATHPMTHAVNTKSEVSAIFDNISYNKAASILRMLSHMIGSDRFQNALRLYINDHAYEAVTSNDLFLAFEKAYPGDAEITKQWASWTKTPGFPLITAKIKDKILNVTQKRFMQADGINNSKNEHYNVPITIAIDSKDYSDTKPKFILGIGDAGKTFELTSAPEKYYILNVQQTGYYRVNYEEENWKKISEALHLEKHDNIHVMNRAQIVDDLFQLSRAGIIKYSTSIDIIRYIKNETNYIPWLSAFNHGFTFLAQRTNNDNKDVFKWFILDLLENIYKHLTFNSKSSDRRTDIYNRNNVLWWACKYGHEECLKLSKDAFDGYMKGTKVHKDLRTVVYCNGIRQGNTTHFNFLYDKFMSQTIMAEQLNILSGLACTKDSASMTKYLNRVINTDEVRRQDKGSSITNALNANPENIQMIFAYIKANINEWRKAMGGLGTLSTIAERLTTKQEVDNFEAFLNEKKTDLGDSHDSLLKSLAKARTNLEWDNKYFKEFTDHLTKLKNSAPMKSISLIMAALLFAVLCIFN